MGKFADYSDGSSRSPLAGRSVNCPACAAPLPEVARFCRRCGSPVRRRVPCPTVAPAAEDAAAGPASTVASSRKAGTVTVSAGYVDLAGKATVAVAAITSVAVEPRRNFTLSDSAGSLVAGGGLAFAGLGVTEQVGCVGVLMVLVGAGVGLKGMVAGLATREWFALVVSTADGRRHELVCTKRRPLDRAAAAIAEAMSRP